MGNLLTNETQFFEYPHSTGKLSFVVFENWQLFSNSAFPILTTTTTGNRYSDV
jgi:hypothetical protein